MPLVQHGPAGVACQVFLQCSCGVGDWRWWPHMVTVGEWTAYACGMCAGVTMHRVVAVAPIGHLMMVTTGDASWDEGGPECGAFSTSPPTPAPGGTWQPVPADAIEWTCPVCGGDLLLCRHKPPFGEPEAPEPWTRPKRHVALDED